jgi:hypothetical protein
LIKVPYFYSLSKKQLKDLREKDMRWANIHQPRSLDESYYLGLSKDQLSRRNNEQVISGAEENEEQKRVLMVSQLWLWIMDDVVVSAAPGFESKKHPDEPSLAKEFSDGNLQAGKDFTSWQLAALIFSECVNYLDHPKCAGLGKPIFYTYEKMVATIYDEVQSYMEQKGVDKIQIEKERTFLSRISDIRDELAMIKSVLTEQGELWDLFYKNFEKRVSERANRPQEQISKFQLAEWDNNVARSVNRPQEQIPKFQRRIQKIDEDAQRVEQWVQGQLDLKKTHASLRDSHNSTLLSTAVIGFTIITVIFTPLSFMTSLLALPSVDFQTQYGDNKYYRDYLGGFISKFTHLLMCQH